MTDNQTEKIIYLLENIEKHLQAIDWKFWDLHQQFDKEKSNIEVENTETPIKEEVIVNDELESLAEIVSTSVDIPAAEKPVVKHTLKYPSIEVLK